MAALDRFSDLLDHLVQHQSPLRTQSVGGKTTEGGELYCVQCGAMRRMRLHVVYSSPFTRDTNLAVTAEQIVPSLFWAQCLQCNASYTIVTYAGPDGPSLVVLPMLRGGIASPNAPEAVRYYLDQAHRCESMGAHSAATSMYRAALEHLLFEQGYEDRMLGPKLKRFKADIDAGTAPDWTKAIDPGFMGVIKELGDAAIHPNEGDMSEQAKFDQGLTQKVRAAFLLLLQVVYEEPKRREKLLEELKAMQSGAPSSE